MVQPIRVGARLPDFAYRRAAPGDPGGARGEPSARLSELWADGPAMLVWLRQCG